MIDDQRTGFLAGNAAEFMAAVAVIGADSPRIREVLANARSRIETAFNLKSALRSLDNVYLDVT
jgi:hypothetical protein